MKIKTKVFTLAWDLDGGTGSMVFATEPDLHNYMVSIIDRSKMDESDPDAVSIRDHIRIGEIDAAFCDWCCGKDGDGGFKDPMDTYSWDEHEIEIEVPDPVLAIYVEGGAVHNIQSSFPADVKLFDVDNLQDGGGGLTGDEVDDLWSKTAGHLPHSLQIGEVAP